MSRLDEVEARLEDTSGWLEWISPRATTEIAVVYADGGVYLPTGGTAEEFAFANARGAVYPLTRKDDLAALVAVVRHVGTLHRAVHRDWVRPGDRICEECTDAAAYAAGAPGVAWPCPTAQALDGLEAS